MLVHILAYGLAVLGFVVMLLAMRAISSLGRRARWRQWEQWRDLHNGWIDDDRRRNGR